MDSIANIDQGLGTFFGTSATLHEGENPGLGFFEALAGSLGYIPGDIASLIQSLS